MANDLEGQRVAVRIGSGQGDNAWSVFVGAHILAVGDRWTIDRLYGDVDRVIVHRILVISQRQRELELLQQKKALQDLTGNMRHKDQMLTQQRKQHEDELSRWKHKEQVLNRRIEQLQRDWRSVSTKLEQVQREASLQKKQLQTDQSRTYTTRRRPGRRSSIGSDLPESDRLFPEESFEMTFDKPGIYGYICVPHWESYDMVGTITVKP